MEPLQTHLLVPSLIFKIKTLLTQRLTKSFTIQNVGGDDNMLNENMSSLSETILLRECAWGLGAGVRGWHSCSLYEVIEL